MRLGGGVDLEERRRLKPRISPVLNVFTELLFSCICQFSVNLSL